MKHKRVDTSVHPKCTDFSELTDDMLAEIEWKHNHRPHKSLGYRTTLEYCKHFFNFDFSSVLHSVIEFTPTKPE